MLSKKVKYAIQALLYLTEHKNEGAISARKISEAEDIPYKFLETILGDLKQHKILRSQRGPTGGYSFVRQPDEISVASIMRIIDGPIALTSCTSHNFYEQCHECKDEKSCKIKHLFLEIRKNMLPLLEKPITDM